MDQQALHRVASGRDQMGARTGRGRCDSQSGGLESPGGKSQGGRELTKTEIRMSDETQNPKVETAAVLSLNGVEVVDTFAEAFPITGTRVIITAISIEWAR